MKAGAFLSLAMLVTCSAAAAAAATAPLQASLATEVPAESSATRELSARLDGGDARVRTIVTNREDLRTATVVLRFTYQIPPDTIALDEILDRIVVVVRTPAGERVSRAVIDPHEVNLNPNASTLGYKLTVYRPDGAYRIRIRVFGNYE